MINHALKYLKQGLSIIPVGNDKRPLIKWERYQNELAKPEDIADWWKRWPEANIGIVTGLISGICVVDIDNVDKAMKSLKPMLKGANPPLANTPRGKHLYFKCIDEKLRNNAGAIDGCDLRANGGYVVAPPSKIDGKQYSWGAMRELAIDKLEALPLDIYNIYINFSFYREGSCNNFVTPPVTFGNNPVTIRNSFFNLNHRDNDIFHVATCLKNGKMDKEMATEVCKILANNCNPPFSEKEAVIKVESAYKRVTSGNTQNDLIEWLNFQDGHWAVTDCYNALQAVTKEQKSAIRVALKRLLDKNIIEKHGEKSGCYRKPNKELELLNYRQRASKALDIKFPLHLDDIYKCKKKNIILIAGSPNSGKTAFVYDFIKLNQDNHDILLQSAEGGEDEIAERLGLHEDMSMDDWKFDVTNRYSDWWDIIRPDGVNIIDYMRIYENHFYIGKWIENVYKKLDKGICIICLQKRRGQELAVGGGATEEIPRLYVTMDRGTATIIKCKNWVNKEAGNPDDKVLYYKLVQGTKFIVKPEDYWHHPDKLTV